MKTTNSMHNQSRSRDDVMSDVTRAGKRRESGRGRGQRCELLTESAVRMRERGGSQWERV